MEAVDSHPLWLFCFCSIPAHFCTSPAHFTKKPCYLCIACIVLFSAAQKRILREKTPSLAVLSASTAYGSRITYREFRRHGVSFSGGAAEASHLPHPASKVASIFCQLQPGLVLRVGVHQHGGGCMASVALHRFETTAAAGRWHRSGADRGTRIPSNSGCSARQIRAPFRKGFRQQAAPLGKRKSWPQSRIPAIHGKSS